MLNLNYVWPWSSVKSSYKMLKNFLHLVKSLSQMQCRVVYKSLRWTLGMKNGIPLPGSKVTLSRASLTAQHSWWAHLSPSTKKSFLNLVFCIITTMQDNEATITIKQALLFQSRLIVLDKILIRFLRNSFGLSLRMKQTSSKHLTFMLNRWPWIGCANLQ